MNKILIATLFAVVATSTPIVFGSISSNDNGASSFYKEPAWVPRATMPYDDCINNDFWPASPQVDSHFIDPGFDESRLAKLPPPGVHPRVCITPEGVQEIRQKVALGKEASLEFRTMWERVKASKSAFYALVAQEDQLGHSLAQEMMADVRSLQPKFEKMDALEDGESLWSLSQSFKMTGGEGNPIIEIWSLLDYDYLHGWLSTEDRELVRKTIVRITEHRISNYLIVPDHFMINNHQEFGMAYIRLMLLIEGEEGYNEALFEASAVKVQAMLDWYLSKDGMCYESIKGWLAMSEFIAVGLRHRDVLKHSHLQAKMKFFQQALRWEDGRWQIRDEMRRSAFHVIWAMRYYHPNDNALDLLYDASLNTHVELTDIREQWNNPEGIIDELLLLFADGKKKPATDWTDPKEVAKLKFPITWKDDARGYVIARNSWKNDDLKVGFTCKQDFFYGGHEGSENNRFTIWSDGINWARDVNMLSVKATWLQNMLTVDGKGLAWPPAPGVWLGAQESKYGVTAAGDGKIGYSYAKKMQVHALDSASGKLPYYAPFVEKNYDLTRDHQVAFHPGTVKYNDGYAHTDYGPWSAETRLVEEYMENNPMKQAYRTVHLARGKTPYVLVVDDADKDGREHLYEWNMTLPHDVELFKANHPELGGRRVEPLAGREGDLILTRPNTPRDPKTGELMVKEGDPLCLVRVLWRNSPYGYPLPRLQRTGNHIVRKVVGKINSTDRLETFSSLCIPAVSTSPEFRIMIYPYRHGEPMPTTKWNADRTQLTVKLGENVDRYDFAQTDGGRTVFSMARNQEPALQTAATPPRPVLKVRGRLFDINDDRTTRLENRVPEYPFADSMEVAIVKPVPPAVVVYTLDGTEPNEKSARYSNAIAIHASSTLKARIIDPEWISDNKVGEVVVARFKKVVAPNASDAAPGISVPGMLVRVYEKPTHMWNDKGFFEASKIMLPNLDLETPVHAEVVSQLKLPQVNPSRPQKEQAKGFYRFNGWFHAEESGVYEFSVNSCGPVQLTIAGQKPINHIGVFHQQQEVRRGEGVVNQGWNAFELIICDPLFWNMTSNGEMPFAVKVRYNGQEERVLTTDLLRCNPKSAQAAKGAEMAWLEPKQAPQWLKQGAVKEIYLREGLRDKPDYLDIDEETPLLSEFTTVIAANHNAAKVIAYNGWFFAPESGVYTFSMPRRGTAVYSHGVKRNAMQSQVRIDGQVVAQRGVYGRNPHDTVGLKQGWHPISMRLGASSAEGVVTYPDGSPLPLASTIQRESQVLIQPDFATKALGLYELYEPAKVSMNLPAGRTAQIRYTTDGKEPTASDALYTGELTIDSSCTVIAVPFVDGSAVASPAKASFVLQERPQLLKMIDWDFSAPGDVLPAKVTGQTSIKIDPESDMGTVDGVRCLVTTYVEGIDKPVFLNKGMRPDAHEGFKVENMKLNQNALTFAVLYKSDGKGTLFSKEGWTRHSKRYREVKCIQEDGELHVVTPAGLKTSAPIGEGWNFVVATMDQDQLVIYINGQRVASGEGLSKISTDTFDFFPKTSAYVRYVSLYNRVLTARDVSALYHSVTNN
jgi:hypothetical protein